jgi:hypothetical protein
LLQADENYPPNHQQNTVPIYSQAALEGSRINNGYGPTSPYESGCVDFGRDGLLQPVDGRDDNWRSGTNTGCVKQGSIPNSNAGGHSRGCHQALQSLRDGEVGWSSSAPPQQGAIPYAKEI